MAISQNQQRYLKERLRAISQSKPRRYEAVKLTETAAVKKARLTLDTATAIITAHEDKEREATKARANAIDKMHSDCERAIYFGDSDAALKALDKFEATQF